MRYYIVPQRIQQKTILFNDEQTHHMRKVLRLKIGDKVKCFDEKGNEYEVLVRKLSRESSYGTVVSVVQNDLVNKRNFTLLQSFPSSLAKLDLVIEKCTELGVDDFIFFKSKRSELFVLPKEEKIQRWKRIAIKASEQSQRFSIPRIHVLENIRDIDFSIYDEKLFLYENSENLKWPIDLKKSKNIIAAIGPEGGWEKNEVDEFTKLGFKDIKPFPYILRTETAAIATTSVIV